MIRPCDSEDQRPCKFVNLADQMIVNMDNIWFIRLPNPQEENEDDGYEHEDRLVIGQYTSNDEYEDRFSVITCENVCVNSHEEAKQNVLPDVLSWFGSDEFFRLPYSEIDGDVYVRLPMVSGAEYNQRIRHLHEGRVVYHDVVVDYHGVREVNRDSGLVVSYLDEQKAKSVFDPLTEAKNKCWRRQQGLEE